MCPQRKNGEATDNALRSIEEELNSHASSEATAAGCPGLSSFPAAHLPAMDVEALLRHLHRRPYWSASTRSPRASRTRPQTPLPLQPGYALAGPEAVRYTARLRPSRPRKNSTSTETGNTKNGSRSRSRSRAGAG
eukprot:755490-Hanusia_phi.AAC.1